MKSASGERIVIVGGGLAAVRTAQALRDLRHPGGISLICAEDTLPYDRPPLSKAYLIGKSNDEQIRLLAGERFAELDIDIQLGRRAIGLDRGAQRVLFADGRSTSYDRLVVATGARPIRLPMFEGHDNVHVLRDVADARRLRELLVPGRRIGIVGAGFIGLEIAAVARERGATVTLIERAPVPLANILGIELGACVQRWHERRGLRFHCGASIGSLIGKGRVRAIELCDGSVVEVDAVVLGVGQLPNIEWLEGTGLPLVRGLVCDVHGRSVDPQVFGVGDVVCTRVGDSFSPTRQWTAVTEQARRTAAVLCGSVDPEPVIDDHYFWSDQHGLRLQFAGVVPSQPRLVWVNGGPDGDRFAVLCCTATEVSAVFSLGCARDFLVHSMSLRRGERVMAPVTQTETVLPACMTHVGAARIIGPSPAGTHERA